MTGPRTGAGADPVNDRLPDPPAVGFVLEQTLGHVTHAQNLRSIISADPSLRAQWRLIPFETEGLTARIPGYRTNWTVRAGIRTRSAIASMDADDPLDALFIHTQVPAVLGGRWLRRIPTVVSVDATPLQYDELGEFYAHRKGSRPLERLKFHLNDRCFREATHLVSWSEWSKAGLVEGYGVPPEKVTVIPPGVDVSAWRAPSRRYDDRSPVDILFVGGDLARKGGTLLLDAVAQLALTASGSSPPVHLHLVTRSAVEPRPGVTVHRDLTPNSDELKALYHRADVFCMPTLGDCLPMVLSEAAAAGLPLVSTEVGAIPEIVVDNETGFLVHPGDLRGLTTVLRRLVDDPTLRQRLGQRAVEVVSARFDARKGAERLVAILRAAAGTDANKLKRSPSA